MLSLLAQWNCGYWLDRVTDIHTCFECVYNCIEQTNNNNMTQYVYAVNVHHYWTDLQNKCKCISKSVLNTFCNFYLDWAPSVWCCMVQWLAHQTCTRWLAVMRDVEPNQRFLSFPWTRKSPLITQYWWVPGSCVIYTIRNASITIKLQ